MMYFNKLSIMTLLMNAFAASAFTRGSRQPQEDSLTVDNLDLKMIDFNGGEGRHLLTSGSTYVLKNQGHSKVLDSNLFGWVYPRDYNTGSYQKWIVTCNDSLECRLKNLATSKFLDSNHRGAVYTHEGNTGAYQRWKFKPAGGNDVWFLENAATSKYLGGNPGDVYTHLPNYSSYEKWILQQV